MNLRQQLLARAKVAQLQPLGTQQRNFPENSATTTATTAQQNPANPHEIRVSSATTAATHPQLASCAGGQKTPPKVAQSCASCASVADLFDDRVTCTTCRNLWPGNHCLTHRAAGLSTRDLAQDFTQLMQRCPAFAPLARAQPP